MDISSAKINQLILQSSLEIQNSEKHSIIIKYESSLKRVLKLNICKLVITFRVLQPIKKYINSLNDF